MNTRETLEKIVNKTPMRCRLGWHHWRTVKIINSTLVQTINTGWFKVQRCTRCCLERTVTE